MLAQTGAAASPKPLPLPLGAAAARGAGGTVGPRVLVGARAHSDVPALTALLRRLHARPRVIRSIGVIGARPRDPALLARILRAHPRVAYIERDRVLGLAGDGDVPDPGHGGINFSWAADVVGSTPALAAAGGGSRRSVAVIDTGVDVGHPDLLGRIGRTFDTESGGEEITDHVGHGTFVAGLISAVDGNDLGGRGVAGATTIIAVRGSRSGEFTVGDVLRGLEFAIGAGADVVNLSLAGDSFSASQARAFGLAFFNDVLPVAASGNRALEGNPLEFPAAFLGGRRGAPGIGLSVAATIPGDQPAEFSNHNDHVSLAAPGASTDCRRGVFSTVPRNPNLIWDEPENGCNPPLSAGDGNGRWGYGQGTSFAAPLASGIAALTWQVEPQLQSEQVAHVLIRSARQTYGGPGWNEFTGSGIVEGGGAVALARVYDTDEPRARASVRRRGNRLRMRLLRTSDRTDPGHERAGVSSYSIGVSTDGGRNFRRLRRSPRPFTTSLTLRPGVRYRLLAVACDANNNCDVRRLGRFRR